MTLGPDLPKKRNNVTCDNTKTHTQQPRRKALLSTRKEKRRKSGSSFFFLLKWGLIFSVWLVIALLAALVYFAWDLPKADIEAALARRPSVEILAVDGTPIGSLGDLYGDTIPVTELPPSLPAAVLAVEDRRFYHHIGIDPRGLLRALITNIRAGRLVQGGSTITQQAAKNLFLNHERTLKRKIQELLLALWLEHKFTKDQILTLYLNRVYFGAGTYGVDAAAKRYFGVSARNLTPYQSAVLAGLLKAPSRYNPAVNPEATRNRTNVVLSAMVDARMITPSQAEHMKAEENRILSLAAKPRPGRAFTDWIMSTLRDEISDINSDIIVKTTLDPNLQRLAEKTLRSVLDKEGQAKNAHQGAIVVLSPDGAIRAMVGDKDATGIGFNRATQAQRQPGSAFKPFAYIAAIDSGMSPDTIISDRPITIANWSPENFDRKFRGDVSLRTALALSLNAATVDLVEHHIGRKSVIQTANRMGLSVPKSAGPSVVLGTEVTSLLTLTSAYAPLANGGYAIVPYGVTQVYTRESKTSLYHRQGSGLGRVLSARTVGSVNEMMMNVLEWGTGRSAKLNRPAAGKSGTTQDYRDAWFVGYTADYVAGVWVGNDDNSPMKAVTGGTIPAKIWTQIMAEANKRLPVRALPGQKRDEGLSLLVPRISPPETENMTNPTPLDHAEETDQHAE